MRSRGTMMMWFISRTRWWKVNKLRETLIALLVSCAKPSENEEIFIISWMIEK